MLVVHNNNQLEIQETCNRMHTNHALKADYIRSHNASHTVTSASFYQRLFDHVVLSISPQLIYEKSGSMRAKQLAFITNFISDSFRVLLYCYLQVNWLVNIPYHLFYHLETVHICKTME